MSEKLTLWRLTSLGSHAAVSQSTAQAWLRLLQASCIVHLLPPWSTHTRKWLVRGPKLYFAEVGLAAWLLGRCHGTTQLGAPRTGLLL